MVNLNILQQVCCTVTGADSGTLWTRGMFALSSRLECVAARQIYVFLAYEYGMRRVELNIYLDRERYDGLISKLYNQAIRRASGDDVFKERLFAAHELYKAAVSGAIETQGAIAEMTCGMNYEGRTGHDL